MWLLLIAIGAFGLCYIFYRLFPLTVVAVIVMGGVIGYIAFGEGQQASDTVTTTGAAIIIAAFVADILMKFSGLFRRSGQDRRAQDRRDQHTSDSSVDDKALRRNIRR